MLVQLWVPFSLFLLLRLPSVNAILPNNGQCLLEPKRNRSMAMAIMTRQKFEASMNPKRAAIRLACGKDSFVTLLPPPDKLIKHRRAKRTGYPPIVPIVPAAAVPAYGSSYSSYGQPYPQNSYSSYGQPYQQDTYSYPQQSNSYGDSYNNPQDTYNNPSDSYNNPSDTYNNPQDYYNNPQQGDSFPSEQIQDSFPAEQQVQQPADTFPAQQFQQPAETFPAQQQVQQPPVPAQQQIQQPPETFPAQQQVQQPPVPAQQQIQQPPETFPAQQQVQQPAGTFPAQQQVQQSSSQRGQGEFFSSQQGQQGQVPAQGPFQGQQGQQGQFPAQQGQFPALQGQQGQTLPNNFQTPQKTQIQTSQQPLPSTSQVVPTHTQPAASPAMSQTSPLQTPLQVRRCELLRYPLPECYTDGSNLMCCNPELEDTMLQAFQQIVDDEGGDDFNRCNIQIIANRMQAMSEARFNTNFEVIVGIGDFASKSHFWRNYMCKIQMDHRYILAYATPKGLNGSVGSDSNQIGLIRGQGNGQSRGGQDFGSCQDEDSDQGTQDDGRQSNVVVDGTHGHRIENGNAEVAQDVGNSPCTGGGSNGVCQQPSEPSIGANADSAGQNGVRRRGIGRNEAKNRRKLHSARRHEGNRVNKSNLLGRKRLFRPEIH